MKKVSVIGAGFVGSTAAQRIAEKGLANVVLLDIVEGMPQGKALDLKHAAHVEAHDCNITGTNDYKDIEGSQVIVITGGIARKPGMTRLDLMKTNAKIVGSIAENVKKHCPDAVVIVVTNPLDIMSYVTLKTTGFEPNRVIGMAGILDSARFSAFISMELGVSVKDIRAMVLGSHGDSMVPIPEYTTVSGIPITELMDKETIERLAERTRKGGGEIVSLLKTGSAYYAPASAIAQMVEAILFNTKRLLPVSAYLQGEYGFKDIYLGVPAILGYKGIEKVVEVKLPEHAKQALEKSAQITKGKLQEV